MAASAGRTRSLSPSESLEREIKRMERRIYDDPALDSMLGVGGKIALLSGLIMALLPCQGRPVFTADSLHGGDRADDNDGTLVLSRVRSLLDAHGCPKHGADAIMGVLGKVFSRRELWASADGGIDHDRMERRIRAVVDRIVRERVKNGCLRIMQPSAIRQ